MGAYAIDNALHEKMAKQANGRLSVENFDGENVDELIKIHQIRLYFPRQKFAPYGTFAYNVFFKHLLFKVTAPRWSLLNNVFLCTSLYDFDLSKGILDN